LFTAGAPFADDPDLFARHVPHALVADALRLCVGDLHAQSAEASFQQVFRSLAPRDHAPLFMGEDILGALGEYVGRMALARPTASGDRKDELDVARKAAPRSGAASGFGTNEKARRRRARSLI
jgi:hypothetical protein